MDELKFAEYNPREIDPESLTGLKESISEFGDISGLTFNTRTGNLIGGHQRVKALKLLGAQLETRGSGRFAIVKGRDGEEYEFSVRDVDWPEDKERRALVAANNEKIQGRWTSELTPLLEMIENESPEQFELLRLDELHMDTMGMSPVLGDDDDEVKVMSTTIQYTIVFDDEEQNARFHQWVKELKDRYPDACSIAARIDKAIGGDGG